MLVRGLFASILVFLLIGCSAPADTPEPTRTPLPTRTLPAITVIWTATAPPPTVAPTVAVIPTSPVSALPTRCRSESQSLVAEPRDKYCLTFPARFKPRSLTPGQVEISGPPLDNNPEPVFANLTIDVKPLKAGTTLKQAVDAFIAEQPKVKPAITRRTITVGRLPAEQLENVPARLASRNILMVHGDKLFNLWFQPLGIAKAKPDVDALYTAVVNSFSFLPDLTWSDAQALIAGGQVKGVFQSHSLDVTLTLADGRTLTTIEPQIDAVINAVKQCGAKCANTTIATE